MTYADLCSIAMAILYKIKVGLIIVACWSRVIKVIRGSFTIRPVPVWLSPVENTCRAIGRAMVRFM